jgi:hypothetical protein
MEKEAGVEEDVEERQIMEAVSDLRRLQREMKPPAHVDDPERLVRACCLLDEIQMMCLRYVRKNGLQRHRRWAADLLLRAVWERNRLDARRRRREE